MFGNKPVEVSELFAGDIGAIAKTDRNKNREYIVHKDNTGSYGKTEYSKPYTYMKYVVKAKEMKIRYLKALAKMMAEDVTFESGK